MLMLGCCDVWLYHRNFPLTHIGYYTLHETELGRAEKRRRRGDADSAIMLVLCSPLLCRHNVTQVTLFPHKTPPILHASLSLAPFTTPFLAQNWFHFIDRPLILGDDNWTRLKLLGLSREGCLKRALYGLVWDPHY